MYKITRLEDVTFKFNDGKEITCHYALVEREGAVPKVYKCVDECYSTECKSLLYDSFGKLHGGSN